MKATATADTKKTVQDVITDLIIQKLEAGVVPWKKPWNGSQNCPKNLFTLKPYRGVNSFILGCCDHSLPFYATYKQIIDHKGIRSVRTFVPRFCPDAGASFLRPAPFALFFVFSTTFLLVFMFYPYCYFVLRYYIYRQ